MRVCETVGCPDFPCTDVQHASYNVPDVEIDPQRVRVVLISEAAAAPGNGYYAPGSPLFAQTTVQAFRDAGAGMASIADILDRGVYLTTAVKCGKTGYGIRTPTVRQCAAVLLARELALFPNIRAYLLMGDVAIQAVNHLSQRAGLGRVTPAGSTYKLRGQSYYFLGARAFPSYLQAGPAFFIEKSKRAMIAEDIAAALEVART
jgi:uracil-DNA glycosylase